jgi:hypothetical protein
MPPTSPRRLALWPDLHRCDRMCERTEPASLGCGGPASRKRGALTGPEPRQRRRVARVPPGSIERSVNAPLTMSGNFKLATSPQSTRTFSHPRLAQRRSRRGSQTQCPAAHGTQRDLRSPKFRWSSNPAPRRPGSIGHAGSDQATQRRSASSSTGAPDQGFGSENLFAEAGRRPHAVKRASRSARSGSWLSPPTGVRTRPHGIGAIARPDLSGADREAHARRG